MAGTCGSFLQNLWNANLIVCSETFKDTQIVAGQKQIQSVVDNYETNYGSDSPVVQVGQQSANAQKLAFVNDVNKIFTDVENSDEGKTCDDGSPGINLSIIGLPCIKYSWLKWGAVGIVALGVLYVLALVSSIVPRR